MVHRKGTSAPRSLPFLLVYPGVGATPHRSSSQSPGRASTALGSHHGHPAQRFLSHSWGQPKMCRLLVHLEMRRVNGRMSLADEKPRSTRPLSSQGWPPGKCHWLAVGKDAGTLWTPPRTAKPACDGHSTDVIKDSEPPGCSSKRPAMHPVPGTFLATLLSVIHVARVEVAPIWL